MSRDPDAGRWPGATWACVALLAAASSVRLAGALGADDRWWSVPLLGAYPWVVALTAVLTVLVAVTAVWRRRHRAPLVVLLAMLVAAVPMLAPRALAGAQPDAGGPRVTVALANVRIGQADAGTIAELVASLDVDLLAVVESTPGFEERLSATGIDDLLPSRVPGPAGSVRSRGEVVAQQPGFPAGDTPDVRWAVPDGPEVHVTTLHAAAPIGREATATWRRGVARTPSPGPGTSLALGDFNATLDHATMRRQLAAGWRDAARETGAGLRPTYDGLVDRSPGLPMAIDHVLVSPDVAVEEVTVHDLPGSDHRMVVAVLRLPAAT